MTTQIPEFRWDCRPIRNHLCVESFLLIAGRRARQWIVPVQVGAPRGQRLSGMRDRLPDDFDFDSEIEVLPGAVRGEGRGLVLDGKGHAGAVAEGETVLAGLADQLCGQEGIRRNGRGKWVPSLVPKGQGPGAPGRQQPCAFPARIARSRGFQTVGGSTFVHTTAAGPRLPATRSRRRDGTPDFPHDPLSLRRFLSPRARWAPCAS